MSPSGASGAVDEFIKDLSATDSSQRVKAAEALGELGGPRAVKALVSALKDPDAAVRLAAVVALGKLGDRGATEAVARCLQDRTLFVRQTAALSLSLLGDPKSIPALEAALQKEKDALVKDQMRAALETLRPLAPKVAPAPAPPKLEEKPAPKLRDVVTTLMEKTQQYVKKEEKSPPNVRVLAVFSQEGLRVNEWGTIKVLLENTGDSAANGVAIEVRTPMETLGKQLPAELPGKGRGEAALGVKPTGAGKNVPLELTITYRDPQGQSYSVTELRDILVAAAQEAKIPVAPTIVVSGDYVASGGSKAGGDVFSPRVGRAEADVPKVAHPRDYCPSRAKALDVPSTGKFCPSCGERLAS